MGVNVRYINLNQENVFLLNQFFKEFPCSWFGYFKSAFTLRYEDEISVLRSVSTEFTGHFFLCPLYFPNIK